MAATNTRMSTNPVSDAARAMQRRSAASRWGGKSAEEKRAEMSALAKARWAKTKPKPRASVRRSNAGVERQPGSRRDNESNLNEN